MKFVELPVEALAVARRIAQVANNSVVRPRQVAIVKGEKRYLAGSVDVLMSQARGKAYAAATAWELHRICCRREVYTREDTATSDSAICIKACALSRSMMMKRTLVARGRLK